MNMLDDVKFIIPKRNLEANIEIKKVGNIQDWTIQYDKLNLTMHVSTNSTNNRNVISLNQKQVNAILNSKNFYECNSKEIHTKIINIGNLLNERINNLLEQNNDYASIRGKEHIEKIFAKYGKDIIDNTIDYECKKLCKEYNYIPFGKTSNYLDFCIFIYFTWELSFLSTYYCDSYKDVFEYTDKFLCTSYKNIDYMISGMYVNYIEKYNKYDKIKLCLMTTIEDVAEFKMVIATEELIVPVIWETKNILCTMMTGGTYLICEEEYCWNLFLGRKGQKFCKDIECLHRRDKRRKEDEDE